MKLTAIMAKDLQILFKDTGAVVTLFLMPFVFIVVMSFALGGQMGGGQTETEQELPVAYRGAGPLAKTAVVELKKIDGLKIEERSNGRYFTAKSAEDRVKNGQRSMAVVFPDNFSARLDAGKKVKIKLIVDPATNAGQVGPIQGTLSGILQKTAAPAVIKSGMKDSLKFIDLTKFPPEYRKYMTPAAIGKNMARTTSKPLAEIDKVHPAKMPIVKFPTPVQQNVPGYTAMFVFFIVMVLAESVLSEKKNGTFRRLLAAPLSKTTILAGKLVPYFLVNLMQIIIMFGVGRFLFNMSLGRSSSGLVVMSLALAMAATSLGILVAAMAKTDAQIGGVAVLLVLTLAMIGGTMVPLYIMPPFMQSIAKISPHAWALIGYQDLLVRGYGLSEILPEAGVLMGFAAVFFSIGLWRFKFE